MAVVVAVGAVLFLTVGRGPDNSDDAQIKRLVTNFADAANSADQAKLISLLCAEETSGITDSEDYDPANDGGVVTTTKLVIVTSDVRVTGAIASAKITRPDRSTGMLYFRREGGRWTVCAPAAHQLVASPATSATG